MRHLKQFHHPADVVTEMTPNYPHSTTLLYRDDEYAAAAIDHLRFNHVLKEQARLSNSVFKTLKCDECALVIEDNGGVSVVTLMAKNRWKLESIVSELAEAKLAGERLENWRIPVKDSQPTIQVRSSKPLQARSAIQFDMPEIPTPT